MKVIGVNGSPRRAGNTGRLVAEALRGAQEAGAEIARYDLYELDFKGCISCFACKRIEEQSCVCRVDDGLRPLLQAVQECDGLVLGSPIYFGGVTSATEAFLERLAFPALSYDNFGSIFTGKVNCALIFTMNVADASGYQQLFEQKAGMLGSLKGRVETYASTFTVQFPDYAKYHAAGMEGDKRLARQKEQFPLDLRYAFEMGARLAGK